MNTFQFITLPLVGSLFILSLFKLFKGKKPRGIWVINAAVWLAAGIAIFHPEETHKIAWMLGIGRGADLLLYLLILSYLLSIFYIYTKFQKLESNITEIVRQLTIQDAFHTQPQNKVEQDRQKNDTETKSSTEDGIRPV